MGIPESSCVKVSVRVREVSQSGLTHDLNLGVLMSFGSCGGLERENLMENEPWEVGFWIRDRGVREKLEEDIDA